MSTRPRIVVSPSDPASAALWKELGRLSEQVLRDGWTLIGGLMVQIHAYEHNVLDVRATSDIDVLANTRRPGTLRATARRLQEADFAMAQPSPDGVAYRFTRDELIVDLLAPEGLRRPAAISQTVVTVSVSGGTQALQRSELVDIEVAGRVYAIRRPTLLGAILIKARSILTHANPEAQRADLLLLLSLVVDPRATASELTAKERGWLREAEPHLRLDDAVGVSQGVLRRARLALSLLSPAPDV